MLERVPQGMQVRLRFQDPRVLSFGRERLFRSEDRGLTRAGRPPVVVEEREP